MCVCVCLSVCSRQMAEKVLREGPAAGEDRGEAGFEGMETLAQAIELGMLLVKVIVGKDTY